MFCSASRPFEVGGCLWYTLLVACRSCLPAIWNIWFRVARRHTVSSSQRPQGTQPQIAVFGDCSVGWTKPVLLARGSRFSGLGADYSVCVAGHHELDSGGLCCPQRCWTWHVRISFGSKLCSTDRLLSLAVSCVQPLWPGVLRLGTDSGVCAAQPIPCFLCASLVRPPSLVPLIVADTLTLYSADIDIC